jgi:hypothetical protein
MTPIRFKCEATLPLTPAEIGAQILNLENWPRFAGYGFIPAIKSAECAVRTPEVVGRQIRVTNMDGSSHVEEIVTWEPESRMRLRMASFSAPLSRLADYFMETWELRRVEGGTSVVRSFDLYPKTVLAKPLLWAISFWLKGAIKRHLREMKPTA